MRAVVHTEYGPPEVLRLAEVARPVPKDDEVLVRVRATTVNRTDTGFRQGKPWFVRFFSGLRRPKNPILGSEFAGEVEAIGGAVTAFTVGDQVFGVNADRFGAHAEYVCVAETGPIAPRPAGMSDEEAAAVCDGAILALSGLRRADLEPGWRIEVYGASGSIGTAAVQLGKALGVHVTAVCNAANVDIVRSLGADEVIDYAEVDFTTTGSTYDFVFDAVGKHSFGRCRRALTRRGIFIGTDLGPLSQNPLLALVGPLSPGRKVRFPIPHYEKDDVLYLKDLIEAGTYRAVIDRTYPLEQVVEATTYVETEQKTGNVVLTI
jgi:NADPH:quinone reductase-like Zn-dependent oxidoreductase